MWQISACNAACDIYRSVVRLTVEKNPWRAAGAAFLNISRKHCLALIYFLLKHTIPHGTSRISSASLHELFHHRYWTALVQCFHIVNLFPPFLTERTESPSQRKCVSTCICLTVSLSAHVCSTNPQFSSEQQGQVFRVTCQFYCSCLLVFLSFFHHFTSAWLSPASELPRLRQVSHAETLKGKRQRANTQRVPCGMSLLFWKHLYLYNLYFFL